MPRAVDVIRRVAPRARPAYIEAFDEGDALLLAHGITTPARLAHFLAQVLHESGAFEIEWENMSYGARRLLEVFGAGRHSAGVTSGEAQALAHRPEAIAERVYGLGNPRKARALGNTQPGDGFRYRGGGLLQTTGRANYRRMGQKCGVDFEAQPDLVLSAEHGLKPALCEWTEGRLNAFADCDDILSISRAINLGNPQAPRRPNGMEDRVIWYAKVRPLIDRVEFSAAAGTLAPQTIAVLPLPAEKVVIEPSMAALIADRFLRFGDRGSDVRAVQRALARLGYGLSGTGNYGANTQAAVADFQARRGLEVDGAVGSETAKAIDAALASMRDEGKPADGTVAHPLSESPPLPVPPPIEAPVASSNSPTLAARTGDRILRIGDAGDLVRAVQLALAELGYDLKGSGSYGNNTHRAVADFQAKHGLEVDGEVGPGTAKAIDAALTLASDALKPADGAAPPRTLREPPQPTVASSTELPAAASVSPTLAASVGDRFGRSGRRGERPSRLRRPEPLDRRMAR
jgi:predicted chitinase/peptidoglycan hydrolase-like protein with peptidoglycan-binding domain